MNDPRNNCLTLTQLTQLRKSLRNKFLRKTKSSSISVSRRFKYADLISTLLQTRAVLFLGCIQSNTLQDLQFLRQKAQKTAVITVYYPNLLYKFMSDVEYSLCWILLKTEEQLKFKVKKS